MSTKIYVGNLAFSTDSAALRALFTPHGEVTSADVVQDRDSGRSRGFGFVEMASAEEAQKAITAARRQERRRPPADRQPRPLPHQLSGQPRPRPRHPPGAEAAPARPAEPERDPQTYRTTGTVKTVLRDAMFLVATEQGLEVMARAAGRMRRGRKIRILAGDAVDLEVSLYDPTRGRIVWRHV